MSGFKHNGQYRRCPFGGGCKKTELLSQSTSRKRINQMTVELFNHLCGYCALVSMVLCLPRLGESVHNLFVFLFWCSVLLWAVSGLYLLCG